MAAYRKFVLMPNVLEILSAEDVQRAIAMGADNAMDLAEFSLRFQPCTLKRLRKDYIGLCARLYMASKAASR
jgi:hypothetical protein